MDPGLLHSLHFGQEGAWTDASALVPEVFELDDDDRLRVAQERPPEALRARVEHAVRRCPKQALAILED